MHDGSRKYLAVDLGAESGRAMLARFHGEVLTVEETHRFANEPVQCGGSLRWDVARLWLEIQRALHKVGDTKLDGIGIDAWGVDYALLGERGQLLENPYHYRDSRSAGMMEEVLSLVPRADIYQATGIQFMPINTLYQLFAAKLQTPRLLDAADRLITIPDLFNYWLTGNAVCEFTNATTTQMVNPLTRGWATGLLDRLSLPAHLPGPLVEPGTVIGNVLPQVSDCLSGTPVIAPACHDTGSAVAAVSASGSTAFLSSGTWSLLGTEVDRPIITSRAQQLNFTNEGGVCGTTRLLKNVMGLWILQGCRKSWSARGIHHEYRDLNELALRETAFQHLIDPDHASFLRPGCMLSAIDEFCTRTGQRTPANEGAYVRAILESLALKYRRVLEHLESLTHLPIGYLRVLGGGSRNELLNQFTADATGRTVRAGPVEATALGNIAMQMVATGATASLAESRRVIERCFQARLYQPSDTSRWDEQATIFEQYCEVIYA